jgi:hypothetical protein
MHVYGIVLTEFTPELPDFFLPPVVNLAMFPVGSCIYETRKQSAP